jgi:hypothetical protein
MKTLKALRETSKAEFTSCPVWPLPALNDQKPVLLVQQYTDPGVELAYEQVYEPDGPIVRLAIREGTEPFFLPAFTPVFAVYDGTIVYAGKHSDGHTVIVQHDNGWMTYYGRMEHMLTLATDHRRIQRASRVKAGNVLGYAGSLTPGPLRALRFELWKLDDESGYIAFDPIRFMRRWAVMPWSDERLKAPSQPARDAA